MEIVIGGTAPSRSVGRKDKAPPGGSQVVEGKLLHLRQPRRRGGGPPGDSGERRRKKNSMDPPGARVMTIMVPDGEKLPKDLNSGKYRIFLRFAKR
jgi:hypothetical protein